MKSFYCLLCAILLGGIAGCKHPLAIRGEGDIVDADGSGRGCTLEQFQSEDPACTVNEVDGDYFVNYRASPRPGWRFVRWEGPCFPQSDFQHCRFDVSADWIARWEEDHPDAEIPATRAVFAPIAGQTGQLVGPGSTIAGVRYRTPTQSGVTDSVGRFYYSKGESVKFSIGATLLGEVAGQARVTPFELAGSPVLTGAQINEAMDQRDEATLRLFNLAVLLHSLDKDADPGNGIEISAGIASLLKHADLDLAQHWQTFHRELALRNALSRGNRHGYFSTTHGITHPPTAALQSLYDAIGISTPTQVIVREERDFDGDGTIDEIERFSYDQAGNPVRFRDNQYWSYDASGRITRYEDKERGSQVSERWYYDENGNPTLYSLDEGYDGTVDHSESLEYGDNAELTSRREDDNGDGTPEHTERWSYQFDDQGRLAQVDWRREGEEPLSSVTRFEYNGDGRLARASMEGDQGSLNRTIDALDFPDIQLLGFAEAYSVTNEYDAEGRLVADTREGSNAELGHYTETQQYDSRGNTTRFESLLVQYGDSASQTYIAAEYQYEYDDRGNITRLSEDSEDGEDRAPDGRIDRITSYQYDAGDRLIREELDWDADGRADSIETYTYDDHGNVLRSESYYMFQGAQELAGFSEYRYEYDDQGKVLKKETLQEGELPIVVEQYRYYASGELASEHRLEGEPATSNVTRWYYNANGRLVREESDHLDNGTIDSLTTYRYNRWNNIVRSDRDDDGDGTPEQQETWRYNNLGLLTHYELQCHYEDHDLPPYFCWGGDYYPRIAGTIEYEYNARQVLVRQSELQGQAAPGSGETLRTTEYDNRGRPLHFQEDQGLDGVIERSITWEYDADGNLTRRTTETDHEGTGVVDNTEINEYAADGQILRTTRSSNGDIEYIARWQYDPEGRETRYEGDEGADGRMETSRITEYDARGNIILERETQYEGQPYARTFLIRREYYADGTLRHEREEEDFDADGHTDNIVLKEYNTDGNLVRHSQNENADGQPETIETRDYDSAGRLVSVEDDWDADGVPENTATHYYDANGNLNLVTEIEDQDGDGQPDFINNSYYQATGWGHVFESDFYPPVYYPPSPW